MTTPATTPAAPRTRYVVIGASNRGIASFIRPLLGVAGGQDSVLGYGGGHEDYSAHAEIVALVDVDRARVNALLEQMLPAGHPPIPVFTPEQLPEMFASTRPDTAIVTSPDHAHAEHILAALAAGVDVISEKPLVTTAADAARVVAAAETSRASLRVTHNLRYTARHREVARVIRSGELGRILHVSMDYHVDIRHGASYFLRWNRERSRSGGLTIHKSTHHLDLIAWWLGQSPATVYAVGGLDFYGPRSPHRPTGDLSARDRNSQDPYHRAQEGSGAFPASTGQARRGLFDLPYETQYPSDLEHTLFDEAIDIEDHAAALITFDQGATAAYSVNFSSPWEGYRATITGTHGSLEVFTGRTVEGEALPGSGEILHRPLFGTARPRPVTAGEGSHDGADPLMRRALFVGPDQETRDLGLLATAEEGARAVAAGEAIWRSIQQQQIVAVEDLLQLP